MNKHSSLAATGSLLERAAEKFDFADALRGLAVEQPEFEAETDVNGTSPPTPRAFGGREGKIDRAAMSERGFVLPDQRPDVLAEEFRIVKRQLLLRAAGEGCAPIENGRLILVCSANPNEGKTFCSINLALSMARETDLDVVLADGDFSKPAILETMGLEDGIGLMDALSDPQIDVEDCLIRTDIPNLSVLPAGRPSDDATEILASQRTSETLKQLLDRNPTRIVVFDSPPALSASPASVLAMHAGQTVMVVKADRTSEAELREALDLLDRCHNIQLLLNGVTFAPNGKKFSSYYGYGV